MARWKLCTEWLRSGFWLATILLFSIQPVRAMDPASIQKFHHAVRIGDVATVRAMLEQDPALVTSTDEFQFQPVHLLDMYFEPEILDLLLANGADINARNDEGVTLLHLVTEKDAVPVLVRKGADLEARDRRGWTPLITQANEQQNEPGVVEALLAAGADPNAKGNDGETALSFARESGDGELTKLLRDAGAIE